MKEMVFQKNLLKTVKVKRETTGNKLSGGFLYPTNNNRKTNLSGGFILL